MSTGENSKRSDNDLVDDVDICGSFGPIHSVNCVAEVINALPVNSSDH